MTLYTDIIPFQDPARKPRRFLPFPLATNPIFWVCPRRPPTGHRQTLAKTRPPQKLMANCKPCLLGRPRLHKAVCTSVFFNETKALAVSRNKDTLTVSVKKKEQTPLQCQRKNKHSYSVQKNKHSYSVKQRTNTLTV